ncbi:lysostaphin resistance A-like protein [Qipengyuania sp.]|uniref:CPBP family intramembrane glutamic endopeptidase n=1 Tax=Qipengyuania sp. TaxID=2004515 RepID=UPI0035198679
MQRSDRLYGFLCLLPLLPAVAVPGLGVLVSLAIVILILIFVSQSRTPTLALSQGHPFRKALYGLGAGLLIAVASHVLIEPLIEQLTGHEIELAGIGHVEGDLVNFLLLLTLGLLFGGIAEELVFRGFVVGWGAAIFGDRAAIWLVLLSATVFGLSHLYQGLAGVITTGLIGLSFGLLYLWNGRKLLVPVIAHMTVNAYGLTLMYLGLYF